MLNRHPIRVAAKITGISLDTLRAWERRYQAVVPERSDRGRQYSPAQIDRLLLLKQLVQRGHAIGVIASVADQDLRNLLGATASELIAAPATGSRVLAPVFAALESFDAPRAEDELSRLAAVLAPQDLIFEVVLPLMQEVGKRWHDGILAIAQEHMVSQILRNLLGGLMRLLRPSAPMMKMIMATPAGELHEFGILAGAMLASTAGVEPIYLGPNLPAREIATAAKRLKVPVVLLGITVCNESTFQEVESVAEGMPEDAELWLGGAGASALTLTGKTTRTVLLQDLRGFENECRRWRENR